MDRSKVINYYKKFPWLWAIVLTGAGVCCYLVPGLIIGYLFYRYYKKIQVTDQEYDNILNNDIEKLSKQAINKAGIEIDDVVAEPLVIRGFPLTGRGSSTFKIKVGKDKHLRFTPVHITIINLLEHQLVSYQCIFDVLTGKALNEKTIEYFYKDIVSVSTETKSEKMENGTQINDAESFMLVTSGGTYIKTTINSSTFVKTIGEISESDYYVPTTEIDAAVQTIRKFVREKKSG